MSQTAISLARPVSRRCRFVPWMNINSHTRAVRAAAKSGQRMCVPMWAWDALVEAGWA